MSRFGQLASCDLADALARGTFRLPARNLRMLSTMITVARPTFAASMSPDAINS